MTKKQENAGVLVGMVHFQFLWPKKMLLEAIKQKPKIRDSFARALSEMDRLERGDVVSIEMPEHHGEDHSVFSLLAQEARDRGLVVTTARIGIKQFTMTGIRKGHMRAWEGMTTAMVRQIVRDNPKLVLWGANHIVSAAPHLGRIGYIDRTLDEIREETLKLRGSEQPARIEKMMMREDARRRQMIERKTEGEHRGA